MEKQGKEKQITESSEASKDYTSSLIMNGLKASSLCIKIVIKSLGQPVCLQVFNLIEDIRQRICREFMMPIRIFNLLDKNARDAHPE
jgi:hypothetical protein